MESLKKEFNFQDKVLDIKLIKRALDKTKYEEFEMALQHKSKLYIYRELKWEVGLDKYLEYAKGTPSRLFSSFIQVPKGCSRS